MLSEQKDITTPESRVAVLIDANSVRDLKTIIKAYESAQNFGRLIYAGLYVEEKDLTLIGAISSELTKRGIDVKVTIGPNEISMSLDAMEIAYEKKAECIIICTRRDSLTPVFKEIKKLGTKTVVFSPISVPLGFNEIVDESYTI
ncbi:MAG: NYN domain-containing protein [Crenarchaeota archaeon]|nr:NYN domain-containing protein [Thermoproteota archaeon]